MVPVLTSAQMREADRRAIQEGGVAGEVLMENAGAAVARVVSARWPAGRVSVLSGKGNNGGDGFAAARHLLGRPLDVFLVGSRSAVAGDAARHLERLEQAGGRVVEIAQAEQWSAAREHALGANVIVDALLGTGLKARPEGLVGHVVRDLAHRQAAQRHPLVAVDLPSGLPSDTGALDWEVAAASVTVTFGAPKCGHVLPPACDRVGELIVAEIGIPAWLVASGARLWLLDDAEAMVAYPLRAPDSHKGSYGHVLVVAGSLGKSGAAALAGLAALRAGAGLVTVATPAPVLPLVAAARPELMTEPLPTNTSGGVDASALERVLRLAAARDAVVLGPGLGQDPSTVDFVRAFIAQCPRPLLVDADGLNAVASGGPTEAARALRRSAETVLTPHPGELARILGIGVREVQARRLDAARGFAAESGTTLVLKGYRSVVASASGIAAVNPTGNPGMATGGTGDVLAGMIGTLLARGCDAFLAAAVGCYLHGLAGDRAAARHGQEGLVAGDVVEAVPEVLRAMESRLRSLETGHV